MTLKDLALAKRAVTTTMIGSLSDVETLFPDLVDTPEFLDLRARILNRGNHQCRLLEDSDNGARRRADDLEADVRA